MKLKVVILTGTIVLAIFSVQFVNLSENKSETKDSTVIQYPENVKMIVDNKCFGCHNPDTKNEKSRNKLNWVTLPNLTKTQQISKLGDIIDVTKKGEMPPKQFLEKKPEAKLTDEESALLINWATEQSDSLMK